jgi:hypothetical protein
MLVLRSLPLLTVDADRAVVHTHLDRVTEPQERIPREPFAALDALEQEARLQLGELQVSRYRCIQVGGDVKRCLHNDSMIRKTGSKKSPSLVLQGWAFIVWCSGKGQAATPSRVACHHQLLLIRAVMRPSITVDPASVKFGRSEFVEDWQDQ